MSRELAERDVVSLFSHGIDETVTTISVRVTIKPVTGLIFFETPKGKKTRSHNNVKKKNKNKINCNIFPNNKQNMISRRKLGWVKHLKKK